MAILKGRLIALALILFYNYSIGFSLVLGLIAAAVFAVAWPWLLNQSLRFKLHNTSYRGLRFRFTGSARFLYLLMGIPLLALLLAGGLMAAAVEKGDKPDLWMFAPTFAVYALLALLFPWLYFRFKRYQHSHSGYGNAMGRFHGRARGFYWIYLQAVLLIVLVTAGLGGLFAILTGGGGGTGWFVTVGIAAALAFYALLFFMVAFIQARLQNYVWNNSLLGLLGFDSSIWARRLTFISVTNLVLIVCTLGFYTPFAAVRMYRYRVESVAVLSTGDLDGFVARQGAEVGSAGEGVADSFRELDPSGALRELGASMTQRSPLRRLSAAQYLELYTSRPDALQAADEEDARLDNEPGFIDEQRDDDQHSVARGATHSSPCS
jgi:uncharacterized membrane protein YjgN (DUF898 family)